LKVPFSNCSAAFIRISKRHSSNYHFVKYQP
jgi:hypothetical protein